MSVSEVLEKVLESAVKITSLTFFCVRRFLLNRKMALSTATRLTFAPGSPFTSNLKLLPGE